MKAKSNYKRILIQPGFICGVRLCLITCLLQATSLFLHSQEIPAIITYDRNEYQGGNKNWGFAEDDEGNLYVANTKGILIYNGLAWQMVHLPNHRVPRSIYRGFDGRIYAGGFETIGYVDRSDPANPIFVETGQEILKGTEEEIWHITGSDDQIMFQSFSLMVFYDGQHMNLYKPHDNIMFGQWINERLWVPQISKGMYVFENGNERTINSLQIPGDAVITGFQNYDHADLIIATRNHGLFTLNDSVATPLNNPFNEQLKGDQINEMIRLRSGDYVIGTIQNGVYITEDFSHAKYHINKSNGLANNTVLSLYETRDGALCVGLNIGLNIINTQEPDRYYYDVDGKLGTVFTSVYYQDKFYVGTNQGVFTPTGKGKYSIVPGSQGQVWSLEVVGNDLLCGHNSGTLQWIDGSFELVSPVTGGLQMQPLNDSQLLQSTYNGLILIEKSNGLWQDIRRISGTDKLVDRFVYRSGEVVGLHPYFGLVYYKLDLARFRMAYRKIFQELGKNIGINALGLLSYQEKILVQVDTSMYEIGEYGSMEKIPAPLQLEINQKMNSDLDYRILKPINNNSEQNRVISYFPERKIVIKSIENGYVKHFIQPSDYDWKNSKLSLDFLVVNNERIVPLNGSLELSANENNLVFQLRKKEGFLQNIPLSQYRLASYDNSWESLPPNGRLEFKQLRHGSYNLQIKQGESDGYTLLSFTISPHWYESWPGALLILLIGAALVWFVNKRNKKRLEQEKIKMQKEKEIELEAERMKARAEKLEHEVAYKSKMLANSAMTMVQKNKMLNELKEVIQKESSRSNSVQMVKGQVIKLIDRNLKSDESWEIFDRNFAEVHEDFTERFKESYPEITPGDLRLAAYIRMNMSSKEIAPILQISVRSVENKRYRLRKKMNLPSDTNLSEYLMRF